MSICAPRKCESSAGDNGVEMVYLNEQTTHLITAQIDGVELQMKMELSAFFSFARLKWNCVCVCVYGKHFVINHIVSLNLPSDIPIIVKSKAIRFGCRWFRIIVTAFTSQIPFLDNENNTHEWCYVFFLLL